MITHARLGVVGVSLAGGVATATTGLRPTGSTPVDAVLVSVGAAACIYVGAGAPWWAVTVAAAVIAAAAGGPIGFVLAAAAGVVAASSGARPSIQRPWLSAATVAAVVVASTQLDVPGPFGLESLIAVGVCLGLAALGTSALDPPERRWLLVGSGALAALAVLAVVVFAVSALSVRDELSSGNADARNGLRAASRGDADEAADWFAAAADSFRQADDRIDRFWTQPARLVPVVAQHRTAGADLSGAAAQASERLAATLAAVDVDSVRLVDGRIDLDAIGELELQLTEMQDVVDELAATVEHVDSPWLVESLRGRIGDLSEDLAERQAQGEDALLAVRTAPSILGADEPKVYLVAFVTPVEARGSVGFLGNVAELTIDKGEVDLTAFVRHEELRQRSDPTTWRIEGMPEFLDHYGRFGFSTGPGGSADGDLWRIVTMSPHFPSTAEVVRQMYPLSGGRPIDGVLALDPSVIAALIEFTGPIEIPGAPTLTADNAAQYLHFDQYVEFDRPDRIDMLEVLGLATIDELLAGALPGPVELGRSLGPLAADNHLAVWFADADAQQLVETIDIDHALPPLGGGDGVAVALNNASGNKIEVFLDADAIYRRRVDPDTGYLEGRLTLELTNNAPSTGLPDDLIGNAVGLPPGSSRLLVSMYAPFPYTSGALDGKPVDMTVDPEQGWMAMGHTVDLAPGQTRVLEITFEGQLDPEADHTDPVSLLPNLARTPTLTVETTLDEP